MVGAFRGRDGGGVMTQQRAIGAFEQCRKQAVYGPWSDQLRHVLTASEVKYVTRLWVSAPGHESFAGVFLGIKEGRL